MQDRMLENVSRLIAIGLMGLGLLVMVIGGVNWQRANEGLEALDAVYAEQNVTLAYDDEGRLLDRGSPEEADAILAMLRDDWKFPVNEGDLDPDDPLVDTPTELMYQHAVISHHVLFGTQEVTLAEDVDYNGETFTAGTYEVAVDGRYWTDFDRLHPLDGQVRELAWEGTVHGLLANLAAGVSADYQAGFAHFAAWRTVLVGLGFALAGGGLFAVASRDPEIVVANSQRERVLTA